MRALPRLIDQNRVEVGDVGRQLLVLVDELLPFERGEPAQLHVEDRVGLDLVDRQQFHQALACHVDSRAVANEFDDVVEPIECGKIRPHDVRTFFLLAKAVSGAPDDDLDLVRDPVPDERIESERAWHVVDQRDHVAAEGVLQLGLLVEVCEDDLGDRVTLQHDHEALPGTGRRVVANVGDAAELSFVHQLGDAQREVVGVHLVRQLGDDEQLTTATVLFDVDHRAHRHRTAAGAVGVLDPAPADDQRTGGKVGTRNAFEQRVEQLLAGGLGVLERPLHPGRDLTQVVRRDVGGHADRDAGRTVDEQVREPRRQQQRLHRLAVVVGGEVDGLLVDVAHHLHREWRHPALGVSHRRRRVVAGRAEVALAVDQRVTQRPRLRQPHERVVDGRVTVRVVLTHDVTDDARALVEPAVGTVAAVVHRVQHPAVYRLETVADVG